MTKATTATSRRLAAAIGGLIAFCALAAPVLDPSVQLYYRDTSRLYYPLKLHIAERLRRGELPLWDPWTVAGVSLLGQMSPGVLHPWTLLYLVFPFDLAFKLNHLLPLVLAGVGAYCLSRRLGASEAASTIGALVFGGSGYLVSQAGCNLIYVVGPAGMPLALERFIAFLDQRRPGQLFAASLLLALCAYGGEPQSMLLCGLIGALFALARAVSRKAGLARSLGATAAWGALALGLAGPVALPAWNAVRRSDRAHGVKQNELSRFETTPLRLLGLAIPRAFDDTPELSASMKESREVGTFDEYFGGPAFAASIYLGSGALLLACFALLKGRRGRFMLFGALFLMLAATGEELGLQSWLFRLVPPLSLFRYAEKLLAPASMLFAVAAALGADAVLESRRRLGTFAIVAGLGTLGFALSASLFAAHPEPLRDFLEARGATHGAQVARALAGFFVDGLRQEAGLLGIFAVAALAGLFFARVPLRALWAAGAAASSILSGSGSLVTVPIETYKELPPLARDLLRKKGPSEDRWRIYTDPEGVPRLGDFDGKTLGMLYAREPLRPHWNSLFGIENVNDYFSIIDPAYVALVRGAPAQAFLILGVAACVEMPGAMSNTAARDRGFVDTYFGMKVLELPLQPRVRLLDRTEQVASAQEAAEKLLTRDPTRTALLLPADFAEAAQVVRGAHGTARYARPSPERISLEVDVTGPIVTEVSEHFDSGWRATIDGAPARTLAVDGAIVGVVVPAGRHSVKLRFIPAGLLQGLALAAAALLLFFLTQRVRSLTRFVTR